MRGKEFKIRIRSRDLGLKIDTVIHVPPISSYHFYLSATSK